ncbi:hypothetical protein BDN70DRAFT_237304 [Pholiota conissans]|uniref:Uncharacterized protein n=1 Tax=Pholiota conissans TaxID=109636 RepID=A0A9P5ZFI1_9AGAR|nr:hypothetical protein BDN70DRAFT_237304 [Pholiota conissans]
MAAEVFPALDVLRMRCPNLYRLEPSGLMNVKSEFLSRWSCITDLKADDGVTFSSDNPNSVIKMPLERLDWDIVSRTTVPGTHDTGLAKSTFSHLRFLRLEFRGDSKDRYQILHQMCEGLPILNDLQLNYTFFSDIPASLSISDFPSVKFLHIHEEIHPSHGNLLRNLSQFFTPRDPATLNIQRISLLIFAENSLIDNMPISKMSI